MQRMEKWTVEDMHAEDGEMVSSYSYWLFIIKAACALHL